MRSKAPAVVTPVDRSSGNSTRSLTVLFFGTSLSAGLGLSPDQAFPAVVRRKAEKAGLSINAVNAGLSGETSAGALRRIDWVLRTPADIIVIETGANDALRGLSVDAARSNIERIVAKAKATQPNAKILLLGMLAPPNLGRAYTEGFRNIYSSVAAQEKVAVLPFFLEGVAGRAELNQPDGVHPNIAGAKVVAENVWRALRPIIENESGRRK